MKKPGALYLVALLWNVAVALPLLVAPITAVKLMGLVAPEGGLADYNARLMGGALVVFGLVYFETGRDLVRYRAFLKLCIAAKVLSVIISGACIATHTELAPFLPPLVGDAVFAALFTRDLRRTPASG